MFPLMLSSQVMTRGKLTYVQTREQMIDYHAFDTIMSSDKLFTYDKDTSLTSISIDTLIYIFDKDYVVTRQKDSFLNTRGSCVYDLTKMQVSNIAHPERFVRDSFDVTLQYSIPDDSRFTSVSCDSLQYTQSDKLFNGSPCLKANYTCTLPYTKTIITGFYTVTIQMDISVITPVLKPGPCLVKCIIKDQTFNSSTTIELVQVEEVSSEDMLRLKKMFEPAFYRHENDIDLPGVELKNKKSYKRQFDNLYQSIQKNNLSLPQKDLQKYIAEVDVYVAKAEQKKNIVKLHSSTEELWHKLNLDYSEITRTKEQEILKKIFEIVYKYNGHEFDSSRLK